MVFFKLLSIVAPIFTCISSVAATPDVFIPLIPQGNVASVTISANTDRRLYYQNSTGGIREYSYTGFFGSGQTIADNALIPAGEALPATPIAAVWENSQIRVYFLSPGHILSEYYFASGWNGGPSCAACLTQYGFTVAAGTVELYATADSTGRIAVGFVSAGTSGTISEAVRDTSGSWTVNALS